MMDCPASPDTLICPLVEVKSAQTIASRGGVVCGGAMLVEQQFMAALTRRKPSPGSSQRPRGASV